MKRFAVLAAVGLVAVAVAAVNQQESDVGYFWHISDTHLHRGYRAGASTKDCIYDYTGDPTKAGRFGDFQCDTPAITMASAWSQITVTADTPVPDYIFWTGDHTSVVDPVVSQEATVFYLQNISAALHLTAEALNKQSGGSKHVKVFPILGNHDSFPAYQFPCDGNPFFVYETIADLWKDWLSPESIATVRQGMFYTELLRPGLRLVALNTAVLWYQWSCPEDTPDPYGQFAWLQKVLAQARKDGEKVYVISHVPPGYDEMDNGPEMREVFNEPFVDSMNGYYDLITASFFGHVHVDSFRLFTDKFNSSAAASSIGFLQGALTPRPDENPSISFFTYSRKSPFTLLDRQTLWFNLTKANEENRIQWEQLYRYTELYRLKDLSVDSMLDFAKRMETDDDLFLAFHDHIKVMAPERMKPCRGQYLHDCRKYFLCLVNNIRLPELRQCLA